MFWMYCVFQLKCILVIINVLFLLDWQTNEMLINAKFNKLFNMKATMTLIRNYLSIFTLVLTVEEVSLVT